MKIAVRSRYILSLIFLLSLGCSKESLQIVSSRASSNATNPDTGGGGGPSLPPPTDSFLFSTKDYFSTGANSAYASINSTAKNTKGEIFLIGSADGYNYEWELRKSIDLGKTWSAVYTKGLGIYSRLLVDDQDHLLVWDNYKDNYTSSKILKSENGGTSWYELPMDSNTFSDCSSVSNLLMASHKINGIQNYVMGGSCYLSTNYTDKWVLARSVDGGVSWFREDPLLGVSLTSSNLNGVKFIGDSLYMFGSVSNNSISYPTVALKNLTNLGSWEVMKDQRTAGLNIKDLDVNSSGDIFTLTEIYTSFNSVQVFKLSKNLDFATSTNWISQSELNSSDHNYFSGYDSYSPLKLFFNGSDLYITGNAFQSVGNQSRWFVVRNSPIDTTNTNLFGTLSYNNLQSVLLVGSKIFMFGTSTEPTGNYINHWITRSLDISNSSANLSVPTATSEVLEDYIKYNSYSNGKSAQINSMTPKVGSNTVYAAGYAVDTNGRKQMLVRISTNLGEGWSTELLSSASVDSELLTSVSTDNGDYYVGGYEMDVNSVKKAVLKKRIGATQTVSYTDLNFPATPGVNSSVATLTKDQNDLYFIVSEYSALKSLYEIKLYHVADPVSAGSVSFSLLETYSYGEGKSVFPTALKVSANREFLLLSAYTLSSSGYKWITLKRPLQGAGSFTVIDDFQLVTGKEAKAQSLTEDAFGNFFVVGYSKDEKDLEHMITRGTLDGGLTWNTVDDYTGTNSYGARAEVVISKEQGDLVIAGTSNNDGAGTEKQWVVRRIGIFSKVFKIIDEKKGASATAYKYLPRAMCFSQDGGFLVGGSVDENSSNKSSMIRKAYLQK